MKWLLMAYLYGQSMVQPFNNIVECWTWARYLNEFYVDANATCVENWPINEKKD